MFVSYAAWSALLLGATAIESPGTLYTDTILPLEKRQVPAGLPKATWGHTYYLHSKASEYTYMSVIYTPGKTPPNPKGSLFLWPGLLDKKNWNKGNLIQSVTELHGSTQNRMVCGATTGQWCIRPFVVDYTAKPMSQYVPKGKIVNPTDQIHIEFTRQPGENGKWSQKITNLSKGREMYFNWERGAKRANLLHLATEIQGGAPGPVDTQRYRNLTLVLKEADKSVGKSGLTMYPKSAIKASAPYTEGQREDMAC